jgi:hypothetical protein
MENSWVLIPFFMLWTFPFWALVLAEAAFLFWCVSYRRGNLGIFSLLVVALAFQFFGNIPIFNWMFHYWDTTLLVIAGWLLFAAPWAILKWWLFVRDNSIRYDEILASYMKLYPELPSSTANWTVEQKVDWEEYFSRNSYQYDDYEYTKVEFCPRASDHRADIMTWMIFWPWSVIWTVVNDPVRRLARNLYIMILG